MRGPPFRWKHDMVVRRVLAARVVERLAGDRPRSRARLDAERPGHAEMHEQHRAVVELGEQIFRAAAERRDAPPGEPRGKAARERKAQVGRAAARRRSIVGALHDRRQPAAHRLHLRQFRHSLPLPRCRSP